MADFMPHQVSMYSWVRSSPALTSLDLLEGWAGKSARGRGRRRRHYPLGMDTLHFMGMVVHRASRWILTPTTMVATRKGKTEDEELDNGSDNESSFPLVTVPVNAVSPTAPKLPSEIQELQAEVRKIREGQKTLLETQARLEPDLDRARDLLSRLIPPPMLPALPPPPTPHPSSDLVPSNTTEH